MSAVLIVGTGDHARVIAELLDAAGQTLAAFVQADADRDTEGLALPAPILRGLADGGWLAEHRGSDVVVAVGANAARRRLYGRCVEVGLVPIAVVHPSAAVLGGATVAPGAQVCAMAVVGVAARVGENVIVNTAASVDHDVVLGPHSFIGPGAHLAGRVAVGEEAHIGLGAVIREGITIGDRALVAAGAVVVEDVPANARVAGVPARPLDPQR